MLFTKCRCGEQNPVHHVCGEHMCSLRKQRLVNNILCAQRVVNNGVCHEKMVFFYVFYNAKNKPKGAPTTSLRTPAAPSQPICERLCVPIFKVEKNCDARATPYAKIAFLLSATRFSATPPFFLNSVLDVYHFGISNVYGLRAWWRLTMLCECNKIK